MTSDQEILADIREIDEEWLHPAMIRRLEDIRKSGANVTVYEIRSNGAAFIIAHPEAVPSMELIREGYTSGQGREHDR